MNITYEYYWAGVAVFTANNSDHNHARKANNKGFKNCKISGADQFCTSNGQFTYKLPMNTIGLVWLLYSNTFPSLLTARAEWPSIIGLGKKIYCSHKTEEVRNEFSSLLLIWPCPHPHAEEKQGEECKH